MVDSRSGCRVPSNRKPRHGVHAGTCTCTGCLLVQTCSNRAKVGSLVCSHTVTVTCTTLSYMQRHTRTCLLRSPGPGLTTLPLWEPEGPAVTATVLPTPISGEPDRNSSSCATPDSWPGAGPAPAPCCCRSEVARCGLCRPCCEGTGARPAHGPAGQHGTHHSVRGSHMLAWGVHVNSRVVQGLPPTTRKLMNGFGGLCKTSS